MEIIFADLPDTVTRTIKVTPPGTRIEGKLLLTFKKLEMKEAAQEIILHDKALRGTDDDGNEVEAGDIYAARDQWAKDFLLENLQEWSLKDTASGELYPVNDEVVSKVLAIDAFFWPIYRDILDYVTKIANGKSKSDQEAEIKNLLNLDKGTTNKRRG
jgi:hypothetical protein